MSFRPRALSLAFASIALPMLATLLGGCGAASVSTAHVEGTALTGKIYGGQQPVNGATISLYAAGLSGNGTGAASLLTLPVFSGADGGFSISYDYTCPSASTQVYIMARGGNPGLPGVVSNPALVMMAPLGDCGNLTTSTFITVNEVTTAASAWALAQFAPAAVSSGAIFGASSTNATGLRNAFLVANNLVDVATGTAGGATLPPGAALEASKLYTLADILAVCINSNGGSACTPLFSAANHGTAPANTLDAALQIVRNPASNVAAVFNAGNAQGPFQPTLAAPPNDWTMSISYIGGGLARPTALGIDSTGSIWAANELGGFASKFSAAGVPASATGFYDPRLYESYGLAIDGSDAAWITVEDGGSVNFGDGSITKFSSSGTLLSGNGFSAGGVYYPYAIAADSNGDIWVADYGRSSGSATLLASDGSSLSGINGFASQIPFPFGVALDGQHNAWFTGQNFAAKVTPNGTTSLFSCCRGAATLALDAASNVWIADYNQSAVVELTPAGGISQILSNGFGGVYTPQTITTDAAGNVWVTNFRGNSISGFTGGSNSSAISSSTGFGVDPGLLDPFGLAVDASGNLWVSNFALDSLTQFVGLAAPTKTPRLGLPAQP